MSDTAITETVVGPELEAANSYNTTNATLETLTGNITMAGPWRDDRFRVDFTDFQGKTWSSFWPDWTHEIAITALTHKLTVVVVSSGVNPWGSQLQQVLLQR